MAVIYAKSRTRDASEISASIRDIFDDEVIRKELNQEMDGVRNHRVIYTMG